jgi:small subunit ribosomal protein S17e
MVVLLGKVRTALVKRTAKKLLSAYPDYFNDDFEHNKKVVRAIVDIPSKKVKNQIAGYITRLVKIHKKQGKPLTSL